MAGKVLAKKNGAPKSSRGATLDDVARLAQVSPITVSRALRKPDIVSEPLRQRIDAAIKQLAYVPNVAASRLASSRTHLVGVIVPTLYNVIFAEYLQALHEELLNAGFQPVVVNSRYSDQEEENAIKTLLGQRVEAIIVVGVKHTPLARRLLARSRIPIVETFQLADDPICLNVGFSQRLAGIEATRYLIKLGFRQIGFLLGQHDERANARLEGYQQAMEEAGLNTVGLVASQPSHSSIGLGSAIMGRLADSGPLPEAIYCIDDNLALGAMHECGKRGIKVPGDLAIIGFHDLEFSACAAPSISSVATWRYETGQIAAQKVIEALASGSKLKAAQIDLGFEIVPRESTPASTASPKKSHG